MNRAPVPDRAYFERVMPRTGLRDAIAFPTMAGVHHPGSKARRAIEFDQLLPHASTPITDPAWDTWFQAQREGRV